MAAVVPEEDEAAEEEPVVVDAAGEIEFDFPLQGFKVGEGEDRVPVVRVALIGEKLLVAVPHVAWHRKVARRLLPRSALQRPVVVEMGCCAKEDREQEVEEPLCRCWMGFLAEEFHASLIDAEEIDEFTYPFVDGGLQELLPSARGLVAAAQEHFAFETAAEEQEVKGSGSPGVEDRLSTLETTLAQMASQMDLVVKGLPSAAVSSVRGTGDPGKGRRPSALKKPKEPSDRFPSLDPSVVAAAIDAGVPVENLQEMEKLMSGAAMTRKKHAEPRSRNGARAKSVPAKSANKQDPLSESVSSGDDTEKEAGDSGGLEAGIASEQSTVAQLAEIVTLLTAEKLRKSKSSKVETALDNMSASGMTETGSLGSGKKAAAARRVLRQSLQDAPEELSNLIEKAMLEDLTNRTMVPGQPAHTLCARAWVEHRSKIGHWKTSAYCAWSAAGALDSLIQGQPQAARARLCLLILMLDQTACDRGSWLLSSELALENGPPMSVLGQHQPPSTLEGEQPFSRLLDARWAEIAMAHVKETEEYVQRRARLGKKDLPAEDPTMAPRAKAKAKAKAAGSQQQPVMDA